MMVAFKSVICRTYCRTQRSLLVSTVFFFRSKFWRFFFFSSRRRHTRCSRDWSSECSSDLKLEPDNSRGENQHWFRDLLGDQQERQGHERDEDRWPVHERPPPEDHGGPGDRPGRRGRDPVHKCLHVLVLRHAMKVRSQEDRDEIDGQE